MANEIPDSPITREEMYLNRIATGGGVIPEKPITRLEQYLNYIANHRGAELPPTANLIAGDGSGGAADSGITAGDVVQKSAQSAKTADQTVAVGADANGKLWVTPGNIRLEFDTETGNLFIGGIEVVFDAETGNLIIGGTENA